MEQNLGDIRFNHNTLKMKKILILGAFCFTGLIIAQTDNQDILSIEKGTWNVGGNLSFGFDESEDTGANRNRETESSFFSFSPNIGYAIKKNLIAGLALRYSRFDREAISMNDSLISFSGTGENTTLGVTPYLRGYLPVGNRLAFYAQFETSFFKTTLKSEDKIPEPDFSENESRGFFVGIRPGITFFVSERFALETVIGSLGYTQSKFEDTADRETTSKDFSFNLNSSEIFFGLSYYF